MRIKLTFFIIALFLVSFSAHSQLLQKIYTYAGNGTLGFSGDGSNASGAELFGPIDVALDGSGNLYISDHLNYRVRKVNAGGLITTVAGVGTIGNSGNGSIGTSAQIVPRGVAVDNTGNLFISDDAYCMIRKVNATGIISVVAGGNLPGYYGDGGPATAAWFSAPSGMTFDASGNLFIADMGNHVIRKINSSGTITTIAGNHLVGSSGDGGPATAASLDSPYAVAVDRSGNLFIADFGNNVVRRVDHLKDSISTYAGIQGSYGYSGDGGAATAATLNGVRGLTVDTAGNLFLSDANNNVVREVTADSGKIYTVVGNGTYGYGGDLGFATGANLFNPYGIVIDKHGSIFIADANNERIRRTVNTDVAVHTILSGGEIRVFPNPFNDNITLTGAEISDQVSILDITGRQVGEAVSVSGSAPMRISTGSLAPGMYLVKVTSASGMNRYIAKLIKE